MQNILILRVVQFQCHKSKFKWVISKRCRAVSSSVTLVQWLQSIFHNTLS